MPIELFIIQLLTMKSKSFRMQLILEKQSHNLNIKMEINYIARIKLWVRQIVTN